MRFAKPRLFLCALFAWVIGGMTVAAPSAEAARYPRRLKLGLALAHTWTDYSELYQYQPGLLIPHLTQRSLLGSATLTFFLIPEVIDLNAEGYLTLAAISRSGADDDLRFFGLNLRAGYVIPLNEETWRFVLFAGWYHTNTLVAHQAYGYRNLYGPQLYPQIEYAPYVEERQVSFSLYGKFSPITDGVNGYDVKNREIAAGIQFKMPVGRIVYPVSSNMSLFTVNFGWSKLQFEHFDVRLTSITQENFTAGLGLQL